MATTCQGSWADTSSTGGSDEESRSDESGSDSGDDYSSEEEDSSADSSRESEEEEPEEDREVGRTMLSPTLAFGVLRPPVGKGCETSIAIKTKSTGRVGWRQNDVRCGCHNNSAADNR